jgi:cytochrome c-type biogenesis protein CcmH
MMQTAFLMLAGLTLIVALAFVLWPLLSRPGQVTLATRTETLREKLNLLKQAQADGLIDESDFETRRKALSDELLGLMDHPITGRSTAAKVTAGLLAALLPPTALLAYLTVGEPRALSFSASARPPAHINPAAGSGEEQAPELSSAADQLRERLQANPEDIEGWLLLARTYRELARFADARDAYANVRAARPDDLDVTVEYAESLGLAGNPRTLMGEPEALLAGVLEAEPNHQRALWLMGFARTQGGDFEGALSLWDRLLAMMDDPDARNALRGQMNQARGRLGMDPLPDEAPTPSTTTTDPAFADATGVAVPINSPPRPASPPGASPSTPGSSSTTAAAPPGATSSAIEVQLQLAPELVSRLAPNDTLFVFAKAEGGPPVPLAVQRIPASALPTSVRLDDSMGMVEGMNLSSFPRVVVEARVSKSGNAQAQPGDLQGSSGGLDNPPSGPVRVVVDRVL